MRRLPYEGVRNSMVGQEGAPLSSDHSNRTHELYLAIESVIGGISPSLEGVVAFTKTVVNASPASLDPTTVDMPWKEDQYAAGASGKKSFGVFRFDGAITPHPPVQRALDMTIAALKKAGHEVIEWTPPRSHLEGIDIIMQIYTADGGADFKNHTSKSGEVRLPC